MISACLLFEGAITTKDKFYYITWSGFETYVIV